MNLLDPKDKRTSSSSKTPQGYFRIGFIALDIPPEDIVTSRVTNADEVTPLRSQYSMFIKTGQTRWDVTVKWTALVTEDDFGNADYSQWEDLRYIVAMFRAAPFVEVENAHLRQVFYPIDPTMDTQRMAFALRQLRIETHNDLVNAVVCTLTMTYFNYYPYSRDFGYVDSQGASGSAYVSQDFKDYLDLWVQSNLTQPAPKEEGDFSQGEEWYNQIPGTLRMRWRRYMPIGLEDNTPQGAQKKFTNLQPKPADKKPVPVNIPTTRRELIDSLGAAAQDSQARYGVPASVTVAQALLESNFGASGLTRKANNWFGIKAVGTPPTDPFVTFPTKEYINGQPQIVQANFRAYTSTAESMNDHGRFLSTKRYRPAFAYTDNPEKFASAIQAAGYATDPLYGKKIGDLIAKYNLTRFDKNTSITTPVIDQKPADPSAQNQTVSQSDINKLNAALANQVSQYQTQLNEFGWTMDNYTESQAFFYQEYDILLTDESNGDVPNDYSLFPQGMVVLMVNNLAQIPLASYQYPTYQHIGPSASMVSFAFTSNGLYDEDHDSSTQEPEHPGIKALNTMAHTLEDQFHRMKTSWRSVTSVHRMQAVRVYNQFLNLCGIHAIMLKDVVTSTMPESANMVTVQMTGAHYENFFEELDSYLVKGTRSAYQDAFLNYLKTDIDKGLTADDKKAIAQVLKYRDARNQLNLDFLNKIFLDPQSRPLKAVPMPISMTADEQKVLTSFLQQKIGFIVPEAGVISVPTAGEQFPEYNNRIVQNGISLTDFLFLTAVINDRRGSFSNPTIMTGTDNVTNYDATLDSVWKKLNANQAEYNKGVLAIYDDALILGAETDPLFRQEMDLVTNDPKFRSKVGNIGQKGGPGLNNSGHGGYHDMGLRDMVRNGKDLNPGYYFYDNSQEAAIAARDGIRGVVGTSVKGGAALNLQSSAAVIAANSTAFDTDNELFLSSINLPDNRMAAAFPTFKLFLLEEDNSGSFYAFDDFYSYSSVTDIEIIRYRDKPDLAVIQLTNLANLLSHKLFDDTVMGKREFDLQHGITVPVTDNKGNPIGGPTGGVLIGGEKNGVNYIKVPGKGLTEGVGTGFNEVPMAYFPLQPGTKIEVRMGSSNNPDELERVFSGTIAEIEGNEILTIRAEGFQSELLETAVDKVGADEFWSLSHLAHPTQKGPRFGGLKIWGDSADTGTIMKKVLEASNAKHFGHWQLLKPANPLMRGWTWTRGIGIALEAMGSTSYGPLLQTGYDRAGDNILINHSINFDGHVNADNRGKRDFFSQTPWWAIDNWYHLDEEEDKNRTLWEILQDVSRRYPEYVLAVKDYGFPYGCDATLVFGHPNDFYYSRPWNYDEGRNEAELNKSAEEDFKKWWQSVGRNKTQHALEEAERTSPYLLRAFFLTGIPDVSTNQDPTFGEIKSGIVPLPPQTVLNGIDNGGVTAFTDMLERINNSTSYNIGLLLGKILPNAIISGGKIDQVRRELLAIQRAWQSYRQVVKGTKFAQLKPVRKYHYVDFQSIVHNGITVDDKIYNAIRLCDKTVKANQNIPDHHVRVLDVDSLIIQPKKNVEDQDLANAYAESFLREEVGKMYHGELILRGLPKIEPWDVIFLTDPSTGMMGPIEVDKVIHSFNQEQGYITIITPRTYIMVNELASQDFMRRLVVGATASLDLLKSSYHEFMIVDQAAQTAVFAIPAAGSLVAAGTVSSLSGAAASAIAAPVVSLIPAAVSPPGWLADAVVVSLALGGAAFVIGRNAELNPIFIYPLMRFGKPWMGGLEGFQVGDFARLLHNNWTQFWVDEIEPTLLSYKEAKGIAENVR
jgi:flagellum-specific peptidoglycan hydrolase FlgJ